MISYLKVIITWMDNDSLLRVINTPVRGIGKTTLETLERVALEMAFRCGRDRRGDQASAFAAAGVGGVEEFRSLIEDGRAMLAGLTWKGWNRLREGRKMSRARRISGTQTFPLIPVKTKIFHSTSDLPTLTARPGCCPIRSGEGRPLHATERWLPHPWRPG